MAAMVPTRVANDAGALQGARHRPRTSGGVTNRPASRQQQQQQQSADGRTSPKHLPPLSEQERAQTAQSPVVSRQHAYARSDGKPLESSGPKKLHDSSAAIRKRCTKYMDKMRQFACVFLLSFVSVTRACVRRWFFFPC